MHKQCHQHRRPFANAPDTRESNRPTLADRGYTARMNTEVLTAEEVAAYLHIRTITVYRWCREGRLPCVKMGRVWRIRRAALDAFLDHGGGPQTLTRYLQSFLDVPDHVIAVAETEELLHRLDAAFFQLGEAHGDVLVKFYAGEPASADQLRVAFTRVGLDVNRLEQESRFRFYNEPDPRGGRMETLRTLLAELTDDGRSRTIWAAFDWVEQVDLDEALRQQQALMEIVNANRLVIKTSVLERVIDAWPSETRRRAHYLHRGTIWLSEERLSLSRTVPTPPA